MTSNERFWTYIPVHELWMDEFESGMATYYIVVSDWHEQPDTRRAVADTIALIGKAGLDMDRVLGHVFTDGLLRTLYALHDNVTIAMRLGTGYTPDEQPDVVSITTMPTCGVCIEYCDSMWAPELFQLRYGSEMP